MGPALARWFAIHEASSGPPGGSWPWLGGVRVLAGGRAAGGELGLQAVEDGLEAELEGVVWCRAVAGGGPVPSNCPTYRLRGSICFFEIFQQPLSPGRAESPRATLGSRQFGFHPLDGLVSRHDHLCDAVARPYGVGFAPEVQQEIGRASCRGREYVTV